MTCHMHENSIIYLNLKVSCNIILVIVYCMVYNNNCNSWNAFLIMILIIVSITVADPILSARITDVGMSSFT